VKRIVVHIDSLVLRGFRHEDRHAIAAGLQAELTRLFAEPSTASRLATAGYSERLKIGNVHVVQGAKPEGIESQVARGIGRGITP